MKRASKCQARVRTKPQSAYRPLQVTNLSLKLVYLLLELLLQIFLLSLQPLKRRDTPLHWYRQGLEVSRALPHERREAALDQVGEGSAMLELSEAAKKAGTYDVWAEEVPEKVAVKVRAAPVRDVSQNVCLI